MDEVLNDFGSLITGEVSTNRPWISNRGISCTCDATETFDHAIALDDHRNNGTGEHELEERFVEWFSFVFAIMQFEG